MRPALIRVPVQSLGYLLLLVAAVAAISISYILPITHLRQMPYEQ